MSTTLTYSMRGSGGDGTGSVTMSATAEGYNQREVLLPPGTTDKEIDLDFAYTDLKGCFITCTGLDDDTTITIKTNSTGAPGDTKTFKTPGSIVYMVDANGASLNGAAAPFSADVTRVYASNPSTTQTGTLRIEILFDATP